VKDWDAAGRNGVQGKDKQTKKIFFEKKIEN
jgi:hypothetical protein